MADFKELLNQYFLDFKNYHLLIIVIVNFLVVIANSLFSYLITRKLLKDKTEQDLIINKGIKYHDLQIEAIKIIYPKIKKLNSSTEDLQNPLIHDNKNDIQNRIDKWIDSFNDLLDKYFENDLFFNSDTSSLIESFIKVHKNLFFQFINNKRAIKENSIEKNAEFPDENYKLFTREQLISSAKSLEAEKKLFEEKNANIIEKLKLDFKGIIET